MKSGQYIEYQDPMPFTIPSQQEIVTLGIFSELRTRSGLNYSGTVVEEIMYEIDRENSLRGNTKTTWKKYGSSLSDFTTFTPNKEGANLNGSPTKWFPQYIADIQSAIDVLVADPKVPDSRSAFLVRAFANGLGLPGKDWRDTTKLKDNITVLSSGQAIVIDPLSRAQAGQWPFTPGYLQNCTTKLGVRLDGTSQADVNTGDLNWPQSVVGKTTSSGVAGFDVPMTADNRPNLGNRKGPGDDLTDRDQGYTYLSHLAHVVQMVRWQPPQVEWFPNNQTPRDYTSNIISSTTPNANWVLAQPVETTSLQNWGNWLIKGHVGIVGQQAHIRAYPNPSVIEGSQGNCPFAVFFPPPTAHCSCSSSDDAYFIWWSNEYYGFTWNELILPQTGDATPKFFNKNTKLKVKYSITSTGGQNVTRNRFDVAVRTAAIGLIDVPWTTVGSVEGGGTGILEIPLKQKLNELYPWYNPAGVDAIMALRLLCTNRASATWDCDAISVPGTGRILPDYCNSVESCEVPDHTALIDYVWLDEEGLAGDPVNEYK